MNTQEILEMWDKDCNIDKTKLDDELALIPKLHSKYFNILINEKYKLKIIENNMKKLKVDKFEFYTQGYDEESKAKGWKLPAKGTVIKTEVPMYMEADDDIIELSLKIGMQQEKVDMIESIIKSLNNRGYNLKAAVDFMRYNKGEF